MRSSNELGDVSTIGKQRLTNYALLARTSDEFVRWLTDNLQARPEYFAREVDLNRRGVAPFIGTAPARIIERAASSAVPEGGSSCSRHTASDLVRLAHVPGPVHIALTGQFASWTARILGLDTPLIITGEDPEHVRESQMRLARVGIENVIGYLADGVVGWIKSGFELDYIPQNYGSRFRRTTKPGARKDRCPGRA